jgi:hypothetical protein
MNPAERSLQEVAQTLAVDVATAQVVARLRANEIPSVVLRGPAVARQLFATDELRTYVDLDLLVAPGRWTDAGEVLRALGFTPLTTEVELRRHRPVHSFEWWRPSDRIAIDLHQTVSGARASAEEVWAAISEGVRRERVGGEEVDLIGAPVLALLVALHVAHHGASRKKPLGDLARALARLDEETWVQAAELAHRIEATAALAAGLRVLPEGSALAERLGLAEDLPVDVALRASGAPPLALGLEWLSRTSGLRAKAALVAHVVLPPAGALRSWRMLARKGRLGLLAAYLSQPFWLARHTLPSLRALRRARRNGS